MKNEDEYLYKSQNDVIMYFKVLSFILLLVSLCRIYTPDILMMIGDLMTCLILYCAIQMKSRFITNFCLINSFMGMLYGTVMSLNLYSSILTHLSKRNQDIENERFMYALKLYYENFKSNHEEIISLCIILSGLLVYTMLFYTSFVAKKAYVLEYGVIQDLKQNYNYHYREHYRNIDKIED